jgi:hypothetical protein
MQVWKRAGTKNHVPGKDYWRVIYVLMDCSGERSGFTYGTVCIEKDCGL